MEKYATLLNLRTLLHSMEHDLGLDDLSQAELDIFLVAQSMARKIGDVVTSNDIRTHDLVKSCAPATYHRALRTLLERGFLRKAEGSKAKSYIVAR